MLIPFLVGRQRTFTSWRLCRIRLSGNQDRRRNRKAYAPVRNADGKSLGLKLWKEVCGTLLPDQSLDVRSQWAKAGITRHINPRAAAVISGSLLHMAARHVQQGSEPRM
jgi:hypothetical protein